MSVGMPAFMVYRELLKPSERLSDVELGRLFRAMMIYAFTDSVPELSGKESVLFDIAQQAIDSGAEKYNRRVEANQQNGKKGGRKPKTETQQNPVGLEETQQIPMAATKTKTKISSSTIAFMDDGAAMKRQQELNQIFDAAKSAGFDLTDTTMTKLTDLAADHTTEEMLAAIDDCAEHGAKSAIYLRKVIDGKKTKKQVQDDAWEFEGFSHAR